MSDWSDDGDRSGRILWTVVAVVLTVVFGGAYTIASWNECTRIHPGWYCAGQQ